MCRAENCDSRKQAVEKEEVMSRIDWVSCSALLSAPLAHTQRGGEGERKRGKKRWIKEHLSEMDRSRCRKDTVC
jgi:hypothetical protein